jgi:flagellin-like protein
MNNYIQLKKTHASCISQNFQSRGIAPVIATLLLVAIAVVGGSMIFVFAQEFFSESQISGTPSIELIKIIGYDTSDAEQVKAHDGIDILPSDCCGESDGLKNVDERIAIYLLEFRVRCMTLLPILLSLLLLVLESGIML